MGASVVNAPGSHGAYPSIYRIVQGATKLRVSPSYEFINHTPVEYVQESLGAIPLCMWKIPLEATELCLNRHKIIIGVSVSTSSAGTT